MKYSIESAKATLMNEAKAIEKMAEQLDDTFSEVIEALSSCSGTFIVSGVGKSGNVAEKMASTLSSVGIPAFYISPLDLFHGGLGVFRENDVFIGISKSGNTSELNRCVRYLAERNITIVSITADDNSELAALSDHVLKTYAGDEACPLNLVPTTSTISAMALCDAIACTLMENKGITAEDFLSTHPGGTLGK